MNSAAELKVLILRQQELAATLARTDRMHGARTARRKLFGLLNQLDLAQGAAGTNEKAARAGGGRPPNAGLTSAKGPTDGGG